MADIEQELEEKHKTDLLDVRYVYLLKDPRDNKPLYVGQAKCVITRLGQHLGMTNHYNPRLDVILKDLKRLYLIPKVEVLKVTNKVFIGEMEKYYVLHYLELYPDLCNVMLTKKIEPRIKLTKEQIRANRKAAKELEESKRTYKYTHLTDEQRENIFGMSDGLLFDSNN